MICFNTGASNRWEEKRWKQDSHRSAGAGHSRDDPASAIILTGGPEEAAFNAALLASDAPFIDGGTDNAIDAFAGIIAASNLVTPDSLGYHIACAVGTPGDLPRRSDVSVGARYVPIPTACCTPISSASAAISPGVRSPRPAWTR